MASCQTTRWVSTAPYVKLTVTQSASTETTATLSYTLQYISDSAASAGTARAYTIKIAGSTVKEDTYNINGKVGTYTIATGTKTINKTTAAQTISFSVSFNFNLTWSGSYKGTSSASGSISVAAKASYKIAYNANGGTGVPSSQTKWHGTALTLSSTKPTRTGYSFKNWNTASGGTGTSYSAGGSYTANAAATLYAQWTANTYAVKYNANGGTGAPSNQTKTYGVTLKLSSTKPTRTNYTFKGWGTSASATTVSYAAGANYTANAAITLYAIWELSYTKPRITSLSVDRCDSAGTSNEEGTYALVKFNWATDQTVSSVKIEWKLSSATSYSSTTVTASGTSGSVKSVIGAGALNAESTYDIRVTVTDANGTNSRSTILTGTAFPIDVKQGGTGVAFGKPAELDGYADFNYIINSRKNIDLHNDMSVRGKTTDGTALSLIGMSANNNTIVGYGSYANDVGTTNIYGHDILMYISSSSESTSWKPYRRKGDSVTYSTLCTAGFVTNAGKDIYFVVPFTNPMVGSPTVTATSINGFSLRQNGNYTHGSSASAYAKPDSYTCTRNINLGIVVMARFSDTTNVTNNAPIGIQWSGTITFS